MSRICVVLLASAALFAGAALAQTVTCNKAQNYGAAQGKIYNTACPAARPYCTGSGLCSECATGKNSICDCPANYKCVAAVQNAVRDADFCAPTPLSVINDACVTANDCAVNLKDQRTNVSTLAFYTECTTTAPTKCRYCNGPSYSAVISCTRGEVPLGSDPAHYGSKSDFRSCAPVNNAWNTNTPILNPPLPTDPYEYERNQYVGTQTPTRSGTPTPSATATLSVGASPSVGAKAVSSMAPRLYCALLLLAAMASLH